MKRLTRSNRLFVVVALAAIACEKPPPGKGRVTGSITTRAAAPPLIALPESVKKVCGDTLPDPTVQISPQGGLANAVVWVEDAPPAPPPPSPPLIDQRACAYVPPVLVGHTGGKLKVKNSDPLMHNVRAQASGDLFNVGMPIENQVIERALPETAGPIRLRCDVHPWMRADVMVLPHEQWAITDSNGAFAIAGVTAGKHPVHLWHPTLGEKSVTVDVPPNGEGKLDTSL